MRSLHSKTVMGLIPESGEKHPSLMIAWMGTCEPEWIKLHG